MESVVVLKGDASNRYLIIAESIGFESHPRRTDSVHIDKGAILLTKSLASYTEYDGTIYRFRWRSGKCVLVGLDYERGEIGGSATNRFSANLLTNKTIAWRSENGKPSTTYDTLTETHTIPLEEFDLDEGVDLFAPR